MSASLLPSLHGRGGRGVSPGENIEMNLAEGIYPALVIVLIVASISDLYSRRIPNWLTFPAMVIGIFYNTGLKGFEGFLFSIGGLGIGIAVLIIPYLMGGMGAGDAKLMGSIGALLGPKAGFVAFLCSAIMGGIYAIVVLTAHGHLRETAERYGKILKALVFMQEFIYIPPPEREKTPRMCYGLAIASGTIISLAFSINIW